MTCVYNDERFLAASIESILSQTYSDFEYIIVDDGSTDQTPDILSQYSRKDPRIHLLTQKNAGPAYAKNKGIEYARNEYIVLQDSDDVSHPERLYHLEKVIQRDNPDILTSDYGVIDDKGSLICTFSKPTDIKTKLSIGINPVCHGATVIRRALMLSAGGFNPFYRNSEDYDLYLRLMEKGASFFNIDRVLYYYRIHQQSVMSVASGFYLQCAYQNHIRRVNGRTEYYPPSPKHALRIASKNEQRIGEAIFWSEDYKKFRTYFIHHIKVLARYRAHLIFYLFSCLPSLIRGFLKSTAIWLRKHMYAIKIHK